MEQISLGSSGRIDRSNLTFSSRTDSVEKSTGGSMPIGTLIMILALGLLRRRRRQ